MTIQEIGMDSTGIAVALFEEDEPQRDNIEFEASTTNTTVEEEEPISKLEDYRDYFTLLPKNENVRAVPEIINQLSRLQSNPFFPWDNEDTCEFMELVLLSFFVLLIVELDP